MMLAATLGGVPFTVRRRLVDHYGLAVDPWLDAVPELMADAVSRWGLTLVNYHDAGCASSIAVARTRSGHQVLVKAWYERSRYAYEVGALRTWRGRRVPEVIHAADDLGVAAIELVAGQPGGGLRRPGELEAVALALVDLHAPSCPSATFPQLDEYLHRVVLPRIERRLRVLGSDVSTGCLNRLSQLDADAGAQVLLHADLYRENVLFGVDERPVFVDPLPMIGSSVFDWAFWVVYYDLLRDPIPRLRLATGIGEIPLADLLPWCLCLCVDGLLYYREIGDPCAPRMADFLDTLQGWASS